MFFYKLEQSIKWVTLYLKRNILFASHGPMGENVFVTADVFLNVKAHAHLEFSRQVRGRTYSRAVTVSVLPTVLLI